MACSRQAGPQAFLGFIEEMTGYSVTQAEWHEMREMAQEEAVRAEYQRLDNSGYGFRRNGDSDGVETVSAIEQARANVGNLLTRERVTPEEAGAAATALARVIKTADLDGKQRFLATEDVVAAYDAMQAGAAESHVTRGTVATIEGIAKRGLRQSVKEARDRIKVKAQYLAEKAAVAKAANAESDPVLKAGLVKAAGLMTERGDSEVMRWRLSGDMEREHPGLSEAYTTATRGSVDARKFSMFSRRGNEAALAATRGVQERILEGKVSRADVVAEVKAAQDKVAARYSEVTDTEPRGRMLASIDESVEAMGWAPIEW